MEWWAAVLHGAHSWSRSDFVTGWGIYLSTYENKQTNDAPWPEDVAPFVGDDNGGTLGFWWAPKYCALAALVFSLCNVYMCVCAVCVRPVLTFVAGRLACKAAIPTGFNSSYHGWRKAWGPRIPISARAAARVVRRASHHRRNPLPPSRCASVWNAGQWTHIALAFDANTPSEPISAYINNTYYELDPFFPIL